MWAYNQQLFQSPITSGICDWDLEDLSAGLHILGQGSASHFVFICLFSEIHKLKLQKSLHSYFLAHYSILHPFLTTKDRSYRDVMVIC